MSVEAAVEIINLKKTFDGLDYVLKGLNLEIPKGRITTIQRMDFSLDEFYRINRRILIWVALFGLIWLLKDFFGLIFLVFVLTFLTTPLSRFGKRYPRLPPRLSIVLVYSGFLLALFFFVRLVGPQVIREANTLLGNLGQIEATLIEQKNALVQRYPSLNPILMGYVRSGIPEEDLATLEVPAAEPSPVPGAAGPPAASEDQQLIRLFVSHINPVRHDEPSQFQKDPTGR